MFIFAFGIVTLGLGWALFWLLSPGTVIWAMVYFGVTLGSPPSATIGMRVMDLEMRTWYGAPAYFVLGAVHAIAFWITVSFFTPFVLLVGFFNRAPPAAARHPARHRRHQQCGRRQPRCGGAQPAMADQWLERAEAFDGNARGRRYYRLAIG